MEVFVNGGESAFTNAFFLIPDAFVSSENSAVLEMSVSENIRAEYKIFKI